MAMRNSVHFTSTILIMMLASCSTIVFMPDCSAAGRKKSRDVIKTDVPPLEGERTGAEFDPGIDDKAEIGEKTASTSHMLEGKTELTEIVLEEHLLYRQAMSAMQKKEYAEAIRYFELLIPQLDSGHEALQAQCLFHEAECHQFLNRMNAAMDNFRKSYELFAKHDSSNPLKGRALNQYESLRALQGKTDSTTLQGKAGMNRVAFLPRKGQFDINPNAILEVKDNNRAVLFTVNDRDVLPKIVKECFSQLTCLETAEIGSNVENATGRWMPLQVSGSTAAFAVNGVANPGFRVLVNGRSYRFDINLPELTPGMRKILVVTDLEKICAVDVDNMDTWLLRITKNSDGSLRTARWYKLNHLKTQPPQSQFDRRNFPAPKQKRIW